MRSHRPKGNSHPVRAELLKTPRTKSAGAVTGLAKRRLKKPSKKKLPHKKSFAKASVLRPAGLAKLVALKKHGLRVLNAKLKPRRVQEMPKTPRALSPLDECLAQFKTLLTQFLQTN